MMDSFRRAVAWAIEHGVKSLIVAGDLFDASVIAPRIIAQLNEMFLDYESMQFYLLTGNHDCSTHSGNALHYVRVHHNVEVVELTNTIFVVREPTGGQAHALFVPWAPGQSAVDAMKQALSVLRRRPEQPKLMVCHFGLYGFDDDQDEVWMQHDPSAVNARWLAHMLEDTSIEAVVAGHFHTARAGVFPRTQCRALRVFQVGSLNAASSRDMGTHYGHIVRLGNLADDGPISWQLDHGITPGVRYVQSRQDIEKDREDLRLENWYITHDASAADVFNSLAARPGDIDETFGAVTVYGSLGLEAKLPAAIAAPTSTPQEAIVRYVEQGFERHQFSGPVPGLLQEALGRIHGLVEPNGVCVPELAPGARGRHALDAHQLR